MVNKADRDGADQTVRDLRAETTVRYSNSLPHKGKVCPSWWRPSTTAGLLVLADGGYRLSKEAIILYGMTRALALGERGIRPGR